MNIKNLTSGLATICVCLLPNADAQSTAFSYQGRLLSNGSAANGTYDFRFTLHDDPMEGSQVQIALTNTGVAVSNGVFTTQLDFGADAFGGADRWLGVGVRSQGSPEPFTTLGSRQPLTPTPYAVFARTAGGVASNSIAMEGIQDGAVTALKIAPDQVVKSINALKDDVVLAAGDNVTLATDGNVIQISAKTNSPANVGPWASNSIVQPVTLSETNPVILDASTNNYFIITLTTNVVLDAPVNGFNRQKVVIELAQDAVGNRSIVCSPRFLFGSDITGITLTTNADRRDLLGLIYLSESNAWAVTSFVRGY